MTRSVIGSGLALFELPGDRFINASLVQSLIAMSRSTLEMTLPHMIVETDGVIYVIGPREGHTWHGHKGMWEVCKIDNSCMWDGPDDEALDRENARKIRDSLNAFEANQARIAELTEALRSIAGLGGNLDDERIENVGGVNDGRARAIMYSGARQIARAALNGAAS